MLAPPVAPRRELPREPSAPRRERPATRREPAVTPRRRPTNPRVRVQPAPKRRRIRPSVGVPVRGLAHAVLPKQSWIDRIVRGRAWIPVFGALLVAIVGMRVEVLKLSSRVGTQIGQASTLQSSNAVLRSTVSELSGNERIEALAEKLGMVMPGPMDIHFVPAAEGSHVQAAIKAISAPAPSSFLTGLAAERQADLSSMTAAAHTSAVGLLADTVTNYGQAVGGGATADPLVGSVGSSSPPAVTGTGTTSGTGAPAASGSTPGSAGSTAAASGVASGSASSAQSGSTAGSTAATVTPTQSVASASATSSTVSAPSSQATTTAPAPAGPTAGAGSGSAASVNGGSSLSG